MTTSPGWLSYRVSLLVAVPLLALASGGLIAVSGQRTLRLSLAELSGQLESTASASAALQAQSHLQKAIPAVESTAAWLGHEPGLDDQAIAERLLTVLRANPGFTWVSYSTQDGTFIGAFRGADGATKVNFSRIASGKTELKQFLIQPDGAWTLARHDLDTGYDPRKRPFYQLAAKAGRRTWTEPYVFYEQGLPGISCAIPLFGKAREVQGVVSIDLDLNQLSKVTSQIRISPHSRVFVFTPEGILLGHPTLKLVDKSGQHGVGKLLTIQDVGDRLLEDLFGKATQAIDPSGQPQPLVLSSDGERYLATYQPFFIDEGVHWIVGTYLPESDFMSGAWAHMRRTTLLSAAVLLVSLALAIALARSLAGPLANIVAQMEKVGRFELTEEPLSPSVFREVALVNRTLETMKGGLRSFASYVPKDLVRMVIASGQEAKLEGKTEELTLFFSDVANFTSLSESMAPDELVNCLGIYLEEMTRIISSRRGTVDKFIGDGIMAFWNAPQKDPDHPSLACLAALACQERLAHLRADPARPWFERLTTRIGIATGDVLVGNVGTSDRMNYTAMGDVVNLAARLEALNKQYGTSVLVTEATYRRAQKTVIGRAIDLVAVKGKSRGIRVYELLSPADRASADQLELMRLSEDALDAYLGRDFGKAGQLYQRILAIRPGDKAAAILLGRAGEWVKTPPPPDWSGVHIAAEK